MSLYSTVTNFPIELGISQHNLHSCLQNCCRSQARLCRQTSCSRTVRVIEICVSGSCEEFRVLTVCARKVMEVQRDLEGKEGIRGGETRFTKEGLQTLKIFDSFMTIGRINLPGNGIEKSHKFFQGLEKLIQLMPTVQNLVFEQQMYFYEFVASALPNINIRFKNLSKINTFEFKTQIEQNNIVLDIFSPKADLIYEDLNTNLLIKFQLSDLRVKLDHIQFKDSVREHQQYDGDDEECLLANTKYVILELSSQNFFSYISFKNFRKIDKSETESGVDQVIPINIKIQIPMTSFLDQGYQNSNPNCCLIPKLSDDIKKVYSCQRGGKYYSLTAGQNIDSNITSVKTSLVGPRPHYTFRICIEPPTDKSQSRNDLRRVDYSHCTLNPKIISCRYELLVNAPIINALETLQQNSLLSIHIQTYFVRELPMDRHAKFGLSRVFANRYKSDFKKEHKRDDGDKQLCQLIEILKQKHLQEFKSDRIIEDDEVVKKICELCEQNLSIRDLELNLVYLKHVRDILYSLRNNYVIKTIRIITERRIINQEPLKDHEETKHQDPEQELLEEKKFSNDRLRPCPQCLRDFTRNKYRMGSTH
ncbi:unnamed protein product [Moneuplotes crassus]|uniref:Uncharacterized protein n=1 Tax=Euplotes crassus TaxID=5936 RepID=A0AAD1XY30_EUPCR|nr:unnamed protein product [Moneuplotes crassus]